MRRMKLKPPKVEDIISSSEAVWRILEFPIHERFPPVVQLAVHLENGQRVYFNEQNLSERVNSPPTTTLLSFFDLCKVDNFAKTLLYLEVPAYYVWDKRKFQRRKRGANVEGWPGVKKEHVLGRVYTVHPNNTQCYHLRMLLHEIRGPISFEALKTVDGHVYSTFQSACKALGLLEDDQHLFAAMEEAALCQSPQMIRDLFTIILVFCQVSDPLSIWEKFKEYLSEDLKRQLERQGDVDVEHITDVVFNKCLLVIEDAVLALGGRLLKEYGLPQPSKEQQFENREFLKETSYDLASLENTVKNNEGSLNDEQKAVYNQINTKIESNEGGIFFLDAPGGTGKTLLINLLLAKVRSTRGIALAVASSGIAATLLEGGRTAHATFKLPLNLTTADTPICNISKQSNFAEVLKHTKMIVWDEITMAHKGGVEALNRTLQDIRGNKKLMGGVTVLLAGDFRQTLPVVPKGTRADEVKACLKRSSLWPLIKIIKLSRNMRVHLGEKESAGGFTNLLLEIGNGDYPINDGMITIPDNLCTVVFTLQELISKIYPDIAHIHDKPMEWLCERVILTPKNDQAAAINDILLTSFEGEEMVYTSIDSVVNTDDAINYPVEFINSLKPSGLPYHKLILRVGTPVMLLRNLKPPQLCNGTRLKVKALHRNVVEATILTGCAQGETVFVPRIPLIPNDLPFEFKRIQFPLKVCFAMTINKSQGQTLKFAGIDLRENCFSHGQFYVACSRVSSPSSLIILANSNRLAKNVVYKEVL